ncbi:hypothetical protein H7Q97_05005 [Ochrobactrum sp. CM-21-5]|nr:hypothetical protein [Ochrobactrum sp. CM-21-5]MBC2884762.1 hypothetical protein [Ochrobactrum sp. CM-21-5]
MTGRFIAVGQRDPIPAGVHTRKLSKQMAFVSLFIVLDAPADKQILLNALRFMQKMRRPADVFYTSLTNSLDSTNHF